MLKRWVLATLVVRQFDRRFQDKTAADRVGKAMEEACRLKIISATLRSWAFHAVCTAIRTSFPGCSPDRWWYGNLEVDVLENVEVTRSRNPRRGVVAGAPGPEECDAIKAAGTWKQTRVAEGREKLDGELKTPVWQNPTITRSAGNAQKPDLMKLASRTRCDSGWESGHSVDTAFKNAPMCLEVTHVHSLFPLNWSGQQLLRSSRLMSQSGKYWREKQTVKTKQTQGSLECAVSPPRLRSARHRLCKNADWKKRSQTPCGSQWKTAAVGLGPVKFRSSDDSTQLSQGAVELELEWDLGGETIRLVAHVVLGISGLLLSRSAGTTRIRRTRFFAH